MKEAVLADTGPLYAAVDPHDSHHQRALRDLQQLEQDRRAVMVSFPILLEAYSLILYRLGSDVASRWLAEVGDASLVNPTPEDYRQAATKLRAFEGQEFTLFDATLAVLASRMGLRVWTYDHHFDVMRIPVWR